MGDHNITIRFSTSIASAASVILLSIPLAGLSSEPAFAGHHKHAHHAAHSHSTSSHKALHTGKASVYSSKLAGRKTASGKRYNPQKKTVASRRLPLGTKVLVKNPKTGKKCTAVVNDKGPFVGGRDLDLSKATARKLGVHGVAKVQYAPIKKPSRKDQKKSRGLASTGHHLK